MRLLTTKILVRRIAGRGTTTNRAEEGSNGEDIDDRYVV